MAVLAMTQGSNAGIMLTHEIYPRARIVERLAYFVTSGRAPRNKAMENLFPTLGSVFQSHVG